MGIDIFGRNTYGGGGMNTYVALQEISRYGIRFLLFS